MAVGESVTNGTLWDTRQPPRCIYLTKYRGSGWWTSYFPLRKPEFEGKLRKKGLQQGFYGGFQSRRTPVPGGCPRGKGAGSSPLMGNFKR